MTVNNSVLVQVLLPYALDECFTYRGEINVKIGNFVKVMFRNRISYGVIWGFTQNVDFDIAKIKPILEIISYSTLKPELIALVDWVTDYTVNKRGLILKMLLCTEALQKLPYETFYQLNQKGSKDFRMTDKRKKLIDFMQDREISRNMLLLENFASNFISNLVKQGILKEAKRIIEPQIEQLADNEVNLSAEQLITKNKLLAQLNGFIVSVLDGVTGSGKTEIYLSILPNVKGQILILVPEIALTNALIKLICKRFAYKPVIWHSLVSKAQKRKHWSSIIYGQAKIIVGTRSALFLPYRNLGLIIVDEEHDTSYKQEEGNVIYNARDIAIVRAKYENIPIILSSATPSIETMVNISNKKFQHIKIATRYGKAELPTIDIVDLNKENLSQDSWISATLLEEIKSNINAGNQTLLFINRKGYAPTVLCTRCKYRFTCKNCSVNLVYYKEENILYCHKCSHKITMLNSCPTCESQQIRYCGVGVERLEAEIKCYFPDVKIAVITSDVMSNYTVASELIEDITKNKYQIIIGTQLIVKGHHFPNLTLVGIIDADMGMNYIDYRVAERNYQILQQVTGRAGRDKKKGRVLVQTYDPHSELLSLLADRDSFIACEIHNRQIVELPPFRKWGLILLESNKEQEVIKVTKDMLYHANFGSGVNIIGATTASIYKINNIYRYNILLDADIRINLSKVIRVLLTRVKTNSCVKVKVNIDPYSL